MLLFFLKYAYFCTMMPVCSACVDGKNLKQETMKRISGFVVAAFAAMAISCGGGKTESTAAKAEQVSPGTVKELNVNSPDCDQYVHVSTNMGDFTIRLFKDAPLHRKNFVNLVMNGYYDGQLFYRAKKNMLIQTGDYTSKTKPDGADLGVTDVEHTVPAEIDPTVRYHKRGAVAAASFNQGEYSSGAHFYIVTGKPAKDDDFKISESQVNKELVNRKFHELQVPYRQEIHRLNNAAKHDAKKKIELSKLISKLMADSRAAVKGNEFAYTKAQRNEYKSIGGLPHLDAHYTVFGEIVDGMDVVEKISLVDATSKGRPRSYVIIKKMTIIDDDGKQ